ncbi:hypothetical protein C2845_PM08G16250 [Panicum miliaceum]|uniref:Uncharacterized protein n=1 Tax=Panicum miliaceum TaxID=4540 RepID=A0A3L6R653_PANMI|nr:hypothetical protein C2845_PM08G16250 [Panicum miliaceum]
MKSLESKEFASSRLYFERYANWCLFSVTYRNFSKKNCSAPHRVVLHAPTGRSSPHAPTAHSLAPAPDARSSPSAPTVARPPRAGRPLARALVGCPLVPVHNAGARLSPSAPTAARL